MAIFYDNIKGLSSQKDTYYRVVWPEDRNPILQRSSGAKGTDFETPTELGRLLSNKMEATSNGYVEIETSPWKFIKYLKIEGNDAPNNYAIDISGGKIIKIGENTLLTDSSLKTKELKIGSDNNFIYVNNSSDNSITGITSLTGNKTGTISEFTSISSGSMDTGALKSTSLTSNSLTILQGDTTKAKITTGGAITATSLNTGDGGIICGSITSSGSFGTGSTGQEFTVDTKGNITKCGNIVDCGEITKCGNIVSCGTINAGSNKISCGSLEANGNSYVNGTFGAGTNHTEFSITSAGGVTCASLNAGSGNIITTGHIEADYFNAKSDKRVKTNIKPITTNVLDFINNLQLYSYSYIFDKNQEPLIGIMAQDILPLNLNDFNFVNNSNAKGTEDDCMSIKESKLVFLLLKAIQEQQKEINELKEKISR